MDDDDVVIIGDDGTEHVFPPGFDPKRAAAIVRGKAQTPPSAAPPPAATGRAAWLDQQLEGKYPGIVQQLRGTEVMGTPMPPPIPAVVSGMATKAAQALPGVVRSGLGKAITVLDNPLVGGTVGAAEGYRRGGVEGAMVGGAAGAAGSSAMARGLQRLATKMEPVAAAPLGRVVARTTDPGIDVAVREALEELRAPAPTSVRVPPSHPSGGGFTLPPDVPVPPAARPLAGQAPRPPVAVPPTVMRAAPAAAPPVAPAAGPSANDFAREVLKRQPDWRAVDAVPVDAITRDITRGGSIIEAGESQIGLGERLAKAVKAGDQAEIERLAKAIRQREHITTKWGRDANGKPTPIKRP